MTFWLAAMIATERPRCWSRLRWVAGVLGTCVVGFSLWPRVLAALDLSPPGGEYGLATVLGYFSVFQFTDLRRLAYVAIPAGLFPVGALSFVRRHDGTAKALWFVALAYFLFFFVQVDFVLHHFVPVMLLPVAAAWRLVPQRDAARRVWCGAAAGSGLLALALVPPADSRVQTAGRTVGASIEDRIGGYDRSAPEQLAASEIPYTLFPAGSDPAVPHRVPTADPRSCGITTHGMVGRRPVPR